AAAAVADGAWDGGAGAEAFEDAAATAPGRASRARLRLRSLKITILPSSPASRTSSMASRSGARPKRTVSACTDFQDSTRSPPVDVGGTGEGADRTVRPASIRHPAGGRELAGPQLDGRVRSDVRLRRRQRQLGERDPRVGRAAIRGDLAARNEAPAARDPEAHV